MSLKFALAGALQIFAFNNAADVPRWAFNFTLVQCALSEPDHAESNTILSYNIIKGKYTFAQLQRLTIGNAFFGAQLFGKPLALWSRCGENILTVTKGG